MRWPGVQRPPTSGKLTGDPDLVALRSALCRALGQQKSYLPSFVHQAGRKPSEIRVRKLRVGNDATSSLRYMHFHEQIGNVNRALLLRSTVRSVSRVLNDGGKIQTP